MINKTSNYSRMQLQSMMNESDSREAVIHTKWSTYEGEVLLITDDYITVDCFVVIKGQFRELDILLTDIEEIEFN